MTARSIFFSGKGGVGKTTMACAADVRYASEGRRTLIVTTDPASNLADVFEQDIGHRITPIEGLPGLFAMEIDPDAATAEYKERALGPLRELFPPAVVQVMEEQMSGPCTSEVAAFDRFTDFLMPDVGDSAAGGGFDTIIFDTAPTGHTIRLLELPAEWVRSIKLAEHGSGQTCIGPTAAIETSRVKYERALALLRDATRTSFVFVLHPEDIAIRETQRSIGELAKLGIASPRLIVNGVIPQDQAGDPLFAARIRMQAHYLDRIQAELPYPARRMYLLQNEVKGLDRVREVARLLEDGGRPSAWADIPAATLAATPSVHDPRAAVGLLTPNGQSRTIFFAGKGGVGKTVTSCATAVWLARRGHRTLIVTTDPAAHLGDVLGVPVGDEVRAVPGLPTLAAAKIDPKNAATAYKARILEDARARGRPPEAIAVMAEELESPCTEEMAAFDRFIEFAAQGTWDVVVFDTAPTGHTLRLLQLPMDWSRQLDLKVFASVDGDAADGATKRRFGDVIATMRDPKRSTLAFVMYPEATPIIEAYRASEELRGLGIRTGLVVANLVIPPEHAITPYTRARRAMQERYLGEIVSRFGVPVVEIPLQSGEVRGLDVLTALGERVFGPASRAED